MNISVGYGFNYQQPTAADTVENFGTNFTFTGVSDTFYDLSAYLKYPIGTDIVSVWPAVGIEKLIFVNEVYSGTNVPFSQDDKDVYSPTLLKIGVGADIRLGSIVLIPYVFYGFNITAVPSSGSLDGLPVSTAFGGSLITGISLGVAL